MNELVRAAAAFRAAIEQTPSAELTVTMQDFPHGACGDATLLLGYFLKTLGFGTFDYVLGLREDEEGEQYSHAWLRQGNVIVDITADQFPGKSPVIVTEETRWHDEFQAEVLHEADFHVYDGYTVAALSRAYAAIMGMIEDRASRC
ncbi:hypothetical protein [Rhizobium sp. 12,4]|uniref:hypothetical protein n=1 Tax=Rhizobium sp. 12,4 TaxID=3405135 RepID=UPI003D33FA44